MSEFCPVCLSKGRITVLRYFKINLSEATLICPDTKCPYPLGLAYTDTFIQQNAMDMGKDYRIKTGMESLQAPVPFPPLPEMNTTKTEPVKGANLLSTIQSLMPENSFELMDLFASDGFPSESFEGVDLTSDAEFESLFKSLEKETSLGNSQKILLGQDTGLSVGSDSDMYTGMATDSDSEMDSGLASNSDSNPNTELTTDTDLNPNSGLTTDSDSNPNTGLTTDSDSNPNTGLTEDSDSNPDTGLTTDSDSNPNTGLTTDSDSNPNTGLTTDSDSNPDTGLTTDRDLRLNTGLSADSDCKLNTGLPTDSDVTLNTQLSVDSDLKLNADLPTGKYIRLNSALPVDCDVKVNIGSLRHSDLKKLNIELSTDSKLNTQITGSSADSFSPRAEGRTVKDFEMKVQMGLLLTDIEQENGNMLAVTESCAKYAEPSISSKLAAGTYEVAPTSCQSQEFYVTSLCDVSKYIGSTVTGKSLLNRSPVTAETVDILQDSVGLETVATAAYDDSGVCDGEMIVSEQPVTKGKIEIKSYNKMACDSSSAEKSFGVLSAEISHSVTNSDNISTANRTDVVSAEVGTPKVTALDKGEQYFTNTWDASSQELLDVGEILWSFGAVDKVVSEKSVSDGIGEVDTPLLIACTARESPDNSCFRVRDENVTAVTKRSFVSENSVPVMVDIENTIQPCNTQQRKLNTKQVNRNKLRSYLKSCTALSYSNKDKFSGFSFEKPSVPKTNLRPCSKKKISKTERLPQVRKIHSEQKELFLALTNNPHPVSSNCNSSSTDSSNRFTLLANHGSVEDIKVESTDVADRVCVNNKSDNGSLDWLQELLM